MITIEHIGTLRSNIFGVTTALSDLSFRPGAGGMMLGAVGNGGQRVSVMWLDSADTLMSAGGDRSTPLTRLTGVTPGVLWLDHGNTSVLTAVGAQGGTGWGIGVSNTGRISGAQHANIANGLPGDATAIHLLDGVNGTVFAVARRGAEGLATYRVNGDGSVSLLSHSGLPETVMRPAPADSFQTLTMAGHQWLVASSASGNYVGLFRVDPQGTLSAGTYIDIASGAGFDAPRDVATVQVGGVHYLIVSGGRSSSLTVLRVTSTGQVEVVDHIVDERATRMAGATAMTTVTHEGRSYVIVGGQDDGISVFVVTPGGQLLLLATLVDDEAMALAKVSALAAAVVNGQIVIAAASATENGITQLRVNTGTAGRTGYTEAGVVDGTEGNDLLHATAGTTALRGGAGDDILISGPGSMSMTGGAGRDIFVVSEAVGRLTITDFNPTEDRIDLTRMGYARSVSDLVVQSTATGLMIRYRDLTIIVNSHDGRSLQPGVITDDMFPHAHYRPPPIRLVLHGTAGADLLTAGPNPAHILGGDGNDTLIGGHYADTLNGGAGHDVLTGGSGNDLLIGGPGRDTLRGGRGDDTLVGGPDNDILFGEDGNDLLTGDGGNDILWGGPGNDTLNGGAGNDRLYGGPGHDRLIGGPGNDLLIGDAGNDTMDGGIGNDTLRGGAGHDRIVAGPGNDRAEGGAGNDFIALGAGDDWANGGEGHDTIFGGSGNDTILGGPGNDLIRGEQGNDRLLGGNGNDTLFGGPGNDVIHTGPGRNLTYGDGGNDTIIGGNGRDTIHGGEGHDLIWGGGGDDLVTGGPGNDTIRGGTGNDTLNGGNGNDRLMGEGGHDELYGGGGNDWLSGGTGNDLLSGGPGNDTLLGGAGNDTLIGGIGRDVMTGGAGADVFVFLAPADSRPATADVITDFRSGTDRLDLSALRLTLGAEDSFSGTAREVIYLQSGATMLVMADLDGDGQADFVIRLANTATLRADDFIL